MDGVKSAAKAEKAHADLSFFTVGLVVCQRWYPDCSSYAVIAGLSGRNFPVTRQVRVTFPDAKISG